MRSNFAAYAVLLSLFAVTAFSSPEVPFAGQVATTFGRPVAVRNAAPTADARRYTLGTFVCAVFPETTLFATEKVLIANGETWYKVQISSAPVQHRSACPVGTTGWMVGVMKRGTSVIAVQEQGATPQVGSARADTPQRPQPENLQPEARPESFGDEYLLLLLGTIAAVVLMTWERQGKVSAAVLFDPLTLVKLVVLGIAAVIILTMLIPVYFQVDPNSPTTRIVQRVTASPGGHILLGFVLTVILMKAVSFARP